MLLTCNCARMGAASQIHDLGYMNLHAWMSHVAVNRRVVSSKVAPLLAIYRMGHSEIVIKINPGPSRCRNGPSRKRAIYPTDMKFKPVYDTSPPFRGLSPPTTTLLGFFKALAGLGLLTTYCIPLFNVTLNPYILLS